LSKNNLIQLYDSSAKVKQIGDSLQLHGQKIHLNGLIGSSLSFVVQSLFKKSEFPFLVILNDKEEAAYYLNDLEQ
jgi:transcription-repair coupling factor (superfamily II helicase)